MKSAASSSPSLMPFGKGQPSPLPSKRLNVPRTDVARVIGGPGAHDGGPRETS